MSLRVFNTLTRSKEDFEARTQGVVRMYVCGLTVYAPMHIGHARTYAFWDTFRRYLEYRGDHVLAAINYTDIDDRIINADKDGDGCLGVAERMIARFRLDCRKLRIRDYAAYTRATDFVDCQVHLAQRLIEAGHAYVVDGEVLYDVSSFEPYGQLSGNILDKTEAGASERLNEAADRKRHPADFTLWKPSKPGEPTWPTGKEAWPSGRPGWHIECSAMSTSVLGDQFDVHGGAVDNLFPHHENELAQSEPLFGRPWVRYWMHPEHLSLQNEAGEVIKMSKSLGNVISVDELLEDRGPNLIRWFLSTNAHYRSRMAFRWSLVEGSREGFERINRLVEVLADQLGDQDLGDAGGGTYATIREGSERFPRDRQFMQTGCFAAATTAFIDRFIEAMDDDLNTPQAAAAMFDYVSELYQADIEKKDSVEDLLPVYRCLTRHLYVFGVELPNEGLYPELAAISFPDQSASRADAVIDRLIELRQEARKAKDFQKSDLIRDLLKEAGVEVEDRTGGARWTLKA